MKSKIMLFTLGLLFVFNLQANDTYYTSLDTNATNFAISLHHLILNHTILNYGDFEIYVDEFASSDAGNGKRKVTCIYSGEEFVYNPPFTWGIYSVEHTWCQSWMPDKTPAYGAYSDYHHLFPANQNGANGVRNNHPLGMTNVITYQFLEGKLGKNEKDQTVYEPRRIHKGDAARALLYMSVCYNGKDTKDWTFNRLNNTILPGLSEGVMDLDLLLFWSMMDPPDAWEKNRNDWVFSKQNNRNPFVDHPEWIKLINFGNMGYIAPGTFAVEPAAIPQNVTATASRTNAGISWSENASQLTGTTGYLVMANTTGSFTLPLDGTFIGDEADLSDGTAVVNIPASGKNSYLFANLPTQTQYYFQIIPYNLNGGAVNYKTSDLSAPVFATTGLNPIPDTPTGFAAKTIRYNQINLNWQKNSDLDQVVLAYSKVDQFGTPVTGNMVSVGDSLPDGGRIIYSGDAESFTHLNLNEGTIYYYKLWSVNPSLNYSAPVSGSSTTYGFSDKVHLIPVRDRAVGFDSWLDNEISEAGTSGNYYVIMVSNAASLITPVIDFNYINKQIVFKARTYNGTSGNSAQVTVSASEDNGLNWTILDTRKPTTNVLTAQAAINFSQSGNQGRLKFETLSATGSKGAGLDDIEITGYENPSSIEEDNQIRNQLVLNNYPNPFNPITTIIFQTAQSGFADLKVYNIKGEIVGTLLSKQIEAGSHSVIFNGQNLASGIYFCKLTQSGRSALHKLVLTK